MSTPLSLSSPLPLQSGAVIPNRFFKSAMSEQLGDRQGNPKPELATAYKRWAEGGLGLSMSGNIMVDRTALGEPANVILDNNSDLQAFRHWTAAASVNGTQFWAQLNHPGKQIPAFLCKEPVAPSAIPLGRGLEKAFNTPRAMTEQEILNTVEAFATAARLAKEAGFAGVQIHGAHGYLVSQFLSPHHNQRDDQWGGSLENRMRFVLAVYHAIRREVGDRFPVGIKLNSADFMKGGFSEADSMAVIKALSDAGIELIEISGGTYENPAMTGTEARKSTRQREAYFLQYAEQARKLVDTPLVVTGGFCTARGMEDSLQCGATDMVGLARPLALDPELPAKVLQNKEYTIDFRVPSTGSRTLDRMMMLEVVWFEQQIHRLAKGLSPIMYLSPWRAVWATLKGMGLTAFKKRRG